MGIHLSFDAYQGSCSTFNDWRRVIALCIGMNWNNMEGAGGTEPWDKWESHNLCALLRHSDCDGNLTTEECQKTLEGLEAILPMIDIDFWRERTERFISGCRQAVANNATIEF